MGIDMLEPRGRTDRDARRSARHRWLLRVLPSLAIALAALVAPPPLLGAEPAPAAIEAFNVGRALYDNGDYARAAEHFHRAFALDPLPEFLYNAARAEQRAMLLAKARSDFVRLLSLSGTPEEVVARARRHLDEIDEVERAIATAKAAGRSEARREADAAPAKTRVVEVKVPVRVVAEPPRNRAGVVVAAIGGSIAVVGGALFAVGYNMGSALDTKLAKVNAAGRIDGISHAEAHDDYRTVAALERAGGVTAAVGALVAVAGGITYFLGPTPKAVGATAGVVPGASGRSFSVWWRF